MHQRSFTYFFLKELFAFTEQHMPLIKINKYSKNISIRPSIIPERRRACELGHIRFVLNLIQGLGSYLATSADPVRVVVISTGQCCLLWSCFTLAKCQLPDTNQAYTYQVCYTFRLLISYFRWRICGSLSSFNITSTAVQA